MEGGAVFMKTRVIVCGCRAFSDKELLFETLNAILEQKGGKEDFEIVSGHAKGADMFAEEFATEKGTGNMIETAKKNGVETLIVRFG